MKLLFVCSVEFHRSTTPLQSSNGEWATSKATPGIGSTFPSILSVAEKGSSAFLSGTVGGEGRGIVNCCSENGACVSSVGMTP